MHVIASKRHKSAVAAAQLFACYAVALFQRTCGAVLVVPVAASLDVSAHAASAIAIVFFWVYAVLQLPSGVLADVLGARRLAIGGCVAMGAGALAFGLSHDLALAIVARGVTAAGCAVIFVAMVRHIKASWTADRVATITGRGVFVGNLGTIASSAPLALLLTFADWRHLSCTLGVISLVFAAGLWLSSRRSTEPQVGRARLRMALPQIGCVLRNPFNHVGLVILAGLAGSYWAFVALSALPLLVSKGIPANVAVWDISTMMACFAIAAPTLGWLADRFKRPGMTLSLACIGAVMCWGLLISRVALPPVALALIMFVLGFCSGGFHLVFALVMERNPIEHAGTVTSYINIGTFLGAATMQSAAGLLNAIGGHSACVLPMAIASALSLILSVTLWPQRERALAGLGERPLATPKSA